MRPVMLALGVLLLPAMAPAEWITISLSPDSIVTCLPEADFPLTTKAYLLVGHLLSPSLAGWEARLLWSNTLQIYPDALYGSGPINVGAFPEYMVGLGEPMEYSPQLVLARVTLLATGPGEVSLGPITTPSILDATGPIYAEGSDVNILHGLPTSDGPSLTVGRADCPDEPTYSLGMMRDPPAFEPPPHLTEPMTTVSSYSGWHPPWTDEAFSSMLNNCDLATIGTILSRELQLVRLGSLPSGILTIELEVNTDLFGAHVPRATVALRGYAIPRKMSYEGTIPVPPLDVLTIGSRVFVGARFMYGLLIAQDFMVCPLRDGQFLTGDYFGWADAAGVIARCSGPTILEAFQQAPTVASVIVNDYRCNPIILSNVRYVRGQGPATLVLDQRNTGSLRAPGEYLILMGLADGDATSLGPRSVFWVKNGRIHSLTGLDYGISFVPGPEG